MGDTNTADTIVVGGGGGVAEDVIETELIEVVTTGTGVDTGEEDRFTP